MAPGLLIDTHCHLDFNLFQSDRQVVIRRACEAGVIGIINPGVDLASSQAAVILAQDNSSVYAAVGIHPNDSRSLDEILDGRLEEFAHQNKVVAIGEIGLDYYRQRVAMDLQWKVFEAQLELAEKMDLPVIVHNREATKDTMLILGTWVSGLKKEHRKLAEFPGVLHSFSGTVEEAEQAVSLGFMVGITGPVTFPKAVELQRVAVSVPLDSLLLETDAPFLTPQPWRGKRNEPSYVRYTAERIANLRGITIDEVCTETTANANRIFGMGETL